MKKSTVTLIVITAVSLALSVVFAVISMFVLAGATKKRLDDVDFGKYTSQIEEWLDDAKSEITVDTDEANVSIGSSGIHVETNDKNVDIGANGIRVN
ncbi:MAG: hypothetical protein K6A80_02900 [Saccharofermentans sp.]|nr:hypothetical protein [Saccharofermentans sp.]